MQLVVGMSGLVVLNLELLLIQQVASLHQKVLQMHSRASSLMSPCVVVLLL